MGDTDQKALGDFHPENPGDGQSHSSARQGWNQALGGLSQQPGVQPIKKAPGTPPWKAGIKVLAKSTNLNCKNGAEHSVASKMQIYPSSHAEFFPEGSGGRVPTECWELPNCLCLVRYNSWEVDTTWGVCKLPDYTGSEEGRQEESNKSFFFLFFFLLKFRLCYYSCPIFSYYFYKIKLSYKDIRKKHRDTKPQTNNTGWKKCSIRETGRENSGQVGTLFHKKSSRKNEFERRTTNNGTSSRSEWDQGWRGDPTCVLWGLCSYNPWCIDKHC